MIHPIIKLIATRPDLLAEHAAGYGALVAAQAGEAVQQWRRNALLVVVGVVCGTAGLGLGGMALLLAAALPADGMPAAWMLWVVPLVPIGVAAACFAVLRSQPDAWSTDSLREQIAADAALWRELHPR
jgi:hypothetical protein